MQPRRRLQNSQVTPERGRGQGLTGIARAGQVSLDGEHEAVSFQQAPFSGACQNPATMMSDQETLKRSNAGPTAKKSVRAETRQESAQAVQPAAPGDGPGRLVRFSENHRIALSRTFFVAVALLILFNEPAISHSLTPVVVLLCAGFLLVVAAVLGRLWCSVYLCGYKNRTVIDKGPYSIVRNPLYLFSLTGAAGIGVTSLSATVTVLILAFFVAMFKATAATEESRLAGLFGKQYTHYRRTTPAFIPDFSLYRSSPEYTIHVRQMNSAFLDVLWFFVVFMLVACLPALRLSGSLPGLLALP